MTGIDEIVVDVVFLPLGIAPAVVVLLFVGDLVLDATTKARLERGARAAQTRRLRHLGHVLEDLAPAISKSEDLGWLAVRNVAAAICDTPEITDQAFAAINEAALLALGTSLWGRDVLAD